jgi:hypothetical protein
MLIEQLMLLTPLAQLELVQQHSPQPRLQVE